MARRPGRGAALDRNGEQQMAADDYVGVILGTFTFFLWALIGVMHWFG